MNEYWSWILAIVGVVGFVLAGRKIWWAWYINIGSQVLWFAYAIITHQLGFLFGSFVYTWVFIDNAIMWTKEHHRPKPTVTSFKHDLDIIKIHKPLTAEEANQLKAQFLSHYTKE